MSACTDTAVSQAMTDVFGGYLLRSQVPQIKETISSMNIKQDDMSQWLAWQKLKDSQVEPVTDGWKSYSEGAVGVWLTGNGVRVDQVDQEDDAGLKRKIDALLRSKGGSMAPAVIDPINAKILARAESLQSTSTAQSCCDAEIVG